MKQEVPSFLLATGQFMELMFKPGDVVLHRLTSEWLMILAQMPEEQPPGYTVRRSSDYGFMNVAYFEVGVPEQESDSLEEKSDVQPDKKSS